MSLSPSSSTSSSSSSPFLNLHQSPVPNNNQEFDFQTEVLWPWVIVPGNRSYVIIEENRRRSRVPRWSLIKEELTEVKRKCLEERVGVCEAIRSCIQAYTYGLNCSFGVLEDMLEEAVKKWGDEVVRGLICWVVDKCLGAEGMMEGVRLLNGEETDERVVMGKDEVLGCLAMGFFCLYPERAGGKGFYSKYPRINFDELYGDKDQGRQGSWRSKMKKAKVSKLLCIFNYFRRMKKRTEEGAAQGKVVFERRRLCVQDTPDWGRNLGSSFCRLDVMAKGSIDDGDGLRVDFANKMVGGGVLGSGGAMEEIFFSCSTELIAAQLFTRELRDNECLIVSGFERFSKALGYADKFRWGGDYFDEDFGCRNWVAIIDAAVFSKNSLLTQLEKQWMDRELTKCYVAFRGETTKVCSGKWGCGVFNGDPLLKCLIQWMACSVAGVQSLELYTFGDSDLNSQLVELSNRLGRCSVGDVYQIAVDFGVAARLRNWKVKGSDLFGFILRELEGRDVVGVQDEAYSSDEEEKKKPESNEKDGWWKWVVSNWRKFELNKKIGWVFGVVLVGYLGQRFGVGGNAFLRGGYSFHRVLFGGRAMYSGGAV